MDPFDEDNIAGDFFSLVGRAQVAELEEIERLRDKERAAMRALAEEQRSPSMTLMQIAGMRTQKELDALADQKNVQEEQRDHDEELKRKEAERARLVNQFPPPDLKHS
jgi:hypothetical protein